VIIEGTRLGAATDLEGRFTILNIPPGVYVVRASAVGFHPASVTNVRVSVDLTTRVDFELTEATIQLNQDVIVVAQRPIVQKDLTSTSSRVGADQIKAFPVEDVAGLVNLQAGVVEGHFRGGRSGEVLYLIDGIPVTDAYTGGAGLTAENHSIQELEVISGTFNAEYGQAMSGVVNQVTKDGTNTVQATVSVYGGDYVSSRNNLFLDPDSVRSGNLTNGLPPTNKFSRVRPNDVYDVQGSLSGPLFSQDIAFFVSGRLYQNDGYLYGRRIFMPTDSSNFSSNDPSQWYRGATGDNAIVSMNAERRSTLQGKFTFRLGGADKLQLSVMHQGRQWRTYDHRYKYNPDGAYQHTSTAQLVSSTSTFVLSGATFLDAHAAWVSNRENSFVYEDPYDPRFPPYTRKLATGGSAFLTGGAEDLHLHRETRTWIGKVDIVSQTTQEHQLKAGVEGKWYRVWVNNFGIENDQNTNFRPQPVSFGRSEFADTILRPRQLAAYVQDKMEFDDLIINLGVRVDYFDSQAGVLAEQLMLSRPKQTRDASPEFQVSPRFGLAFPITDRGVLHLSYGHFFQVPS
ncbi:MAG: TonB-dependent receptor, partial [Bacteroidota bacterium]